MGTLSLTNLTTGGSFTCHDLVGAILENPQPGGEAGPAGVGEIQSFGAYGCESEGCRGPTGSPGIYFSLFAEGTEAAFPETGSGTMTAPNPSAEPSEEPLAASGTNLAWKGKLIEEGTTVRQEIQGAKLNSMCHVGPGFNRCRPAPQQKRRTR